MNKPSKIFLSAKGLCLKLPESPALGGHIGVIVKREDKYWICMDCAVAKGWKDQGSGITMIQGLCGHCERKDKTMLIPQRDFTKPGQKVKVCD